MTDNDTLPKPPLRVGDRVHHKSGTAGTVARIEGAGRVVVTWDNLLAGTSTSSAKHLRRVE